MATILPDKDKKKKQNQNGVLTPPMENLGLNRGMQAISPAPLPPVPTLPPNVAEIVQAQRAAEAQSGANQGGDGGVGVDRIKNKIVRSRAGLNKGML